MVPILHFSGQFRFFMPEANNDPKSEKVTFDPTLSREEILAKCLCNPARYFDFEFMEVYVRSITYRDGAVDIEHDPALNKPINLRGLMVDVSPSAICSQVYAASLEIPDILIGNAETAAQSIPMLNKRQLGFNEKNASADFSTTISFNRLIPIERSRYLSELGSKSELELTFTLSLNENSEKQQEKQEGKIVEGLVLGYLNVPLTVNVRGPKMRNRKLLPHPNLFRSNDLLEKFLTNIGGIDIVKMPKEQLSYLEVEGTYDLDLENRLIALRCLHFIPYLSQDYATPSSEGSVKQYLVSLDNGIERYFIGSFNGTHKEFLDTGGLAIFKIPESIDIAGDMLELYVSVELSNLLELDLMTDSEWDLELKGSRAIYLPSGGTFEVEATVFYKNMPAKNVAVRLHSEKENRKSPIVACFEQPTSISNQEGCLQGTIRALDLTQTGGVLDPVNNNMAMNLPVDRFYGNFLYMEIPNEKRYFSGVERIELATRVLQCVDLSIDKPSYKEHILPLFAYHLRYFPFLHVIDQSGTFVRVFDLEDYASFKQYAAFILHRLRLNINDRSKMPYSRDLPYNGAELIEKWVESGMLP